MIFHLLISFCRCIAQAHKNYTYKSTDKKSYNKSQLKHLFHKVYFSPPDSRRFLIFSVGITSIVLDSSKFHTIRLSLFILNALRQGTHQTALHYSLIGISPPWGSPTAAIFGCDGSITLDF